MPRMPRSTPAKTTPAALKLSPALRRLVRQLAEQSPEQARRMLALEREAIGEYRKVHDAALGQDVREVTQTHTRLWWSALLAGRPPSAEELEPIAAAGRRRVYQDISLPSLLHAVRIASIVLWNALLDGAQRDAQVRDELLFKVSPYLLEHFDLMGQTLAHAYNAELSQHARWRERLQHELAAIVFSHPDDGDGFRSRTLALGLDAGVPHTALALKLGEAPAPGSSVEASLDRVLAAAARCFKRSRDSFAATLRHQHVLLWLAQPPGAVALLAGERQLAEQAAALVALRLGIAQVGIGLPDAGARGWQLSAEQALKAIEVGNRLAPGGDVHRYSDFALDDVLAGTRSVARFLEAMLDRLAAEPNLMETLEAYFGHQQHHKAVAQALSIHPNTLTYRLDRIQSLLGGRLDDVGWLARLHAALRLRRMARTPPPG